MVILGLDKDDTPIGSGNDWFGVSDSEIERIFDPFVSSRFGTSDRIWKDIVGPRLSKASAGRKVKGPFSVVSTSER